MKKVLALVLSALMVMGCIFVFAACSKDETTPTNTTNDSADKADETTAADAETTVADDETTVADDETTEAEEEIDPDGDLAAIKAAGKLVIGITDYAPMDYKADDGSWTGFDAEYASIVAEKLGVEVEFIEIDWNNKEFELNDKQIDCIWNGMTITEDLKKSMDITNPYVKNAQVVVMKKGDIETLTEDQLAEYSFAVESGSAAANIAADNGFNYTELNVQTDTLLEVKAGTSDAAIIDKTMAEAMCGEGTSYEDLGIVYIFPEEEYGVGCRKGSDLCAKINEITAELTEDGTLKTLAEKYHLALVD